MDETTEVDRRRARRFDLIRLAVYKHFDIERVTETINISMGGMKIRTEFFIQYNDTLDVSIKINNHEFESGARVIYCNEVEGNAYEVGLRFEGTSPEHLALLKRYLFDPN